MARLRVTESGFSDVVAAGLKHLRSYRKSTSKCEDDCLHTAAEPLSVQVPAVIVERARPWLLTPSYETTGYNYGRVHLVRDMRDGVVGALVSTCPCAGHLLTHFTARIFKSVTCNSVKTSRYNTTQHYNDPSQEDATFQSRLDWSFRVFILVPYFHI